MNVTSDRAGLPPGGKRVSAPRCASGAIRWESAAAREVVARVCQQAAGACQQILTRYGLDTRRAEATCSPERSGGNRMEHQTVRGYAEGAGPSWQRGQ